MTEREIINLFYPETSKNSLRSEFLDDCALLPGSKNKIVTTDSIVENVHFKLDWSSPEDLAIKLFHVNLSDIISSGGKPEWCLLSLGITKEKASEPNFETFLKRFATTFVRECWQYECPLIGGDTVRTNQVILGLTMGGYVERYIARNGAIDGDTLYVTGDLGLSLAGLRQLEGKIKLGEEAEIMSIEKYLQPHARAHWGQILSNKNEVHAMIDVSDGLLNDAIHLATANSLILNIQVDKIPLAPVLEGSINQIDALLSGEELELLFLGEEGLEFDFPCTPIGKAKKVKENESGVRLFVKDKDIPFPLGRFEHF